MNRIKKIFFQNWNALHETEASRELKQGRRHYYRDSLVGVLTLCEAIKQSLNPRQIGTVFSVLQELLFPLDKTVGDRQSI